MKQSIRNHLVYNWWKYVAVAVVVISIWVYLFSVLARPKENEKIKISFVGNDFKNVLLQEDILNNIDKLQGEQNIKEVGVECLYTEDNYTLSTILSTRVISDTDIVILKQSTLANFDVESFFVDLKSDAVAENFGNIQTFEKSGKIYGIKLNGDNAFTKYYDGKEDCYLFITSVSVNFGGINGNGNKEDRACINLVNYLLGGKK